MIPFSLNYDANLGTHQGPCFTNHQVSEDIYKDMCSIELCL